MSVFISSKSNEKRQHIDKKIAVNEIVSLLWDQAVGESPTLPWVAILHSEPFTVKVLLPFPDKQERPRARRSSERREVGDRDEQTEDSGDEDDDSEDMPSSVHGRWGRGGDERSG